MKNKILFIFIVVISGYMYSQKPVLSENFSFEIGEKYKKIKSYTTYNIAARDRMVSIKKGRTDMTIQRFSLKDLSEDIKKRQIIEDKGEFQTVMKFGNKAIVFYTKKNKAYAQNISLTGIIAEKPIIVGSDKNNIAQDCGFKGTHGFDAGGRINQFVFKKSFDETKLLVLFRVKTANDKADQISINVYDNALAPIWQRKVTLPYPTKQLVNEDFAIDNEGSFYMTASIFSPNSEDKNKLDDSYRTEIFKIMNEPKDIVKSKIEISGKSILDAIIGLNKKGKVNVSGFYSGNNNKVEASGIFSASLDQTGVVNAIAKSNIPQDVLQKYAQEREERINEGTQKANDKKDFEELKVNDIVYNQDGSIVLLGEQRYVEAFTTSSSSGSRTTYTYYYRDIITAKLSEEGKIEWMHKLPKYQIGTRGKRSLSYYNFRHKNKYHLFYIDDFTNLKRSFNEYPTRYFDGKKEFLYLTSYTIDDITGDVIKEPILTGSDVRNSRLDQLEISKVATLPNKDMVFEIFDGKKNNLLLKVSVAE